MRVECKCFFSTKSSRRDEREKKALKGVEVDEFFFFKGVECRFCTYKSIAENNVVGKRIIASILSSIMEKRFSLIFFA